MRDRLRQILVNLVGNAIKFTEHGEIVVEVDSSRWSNRVSLGTSSISSCILRCVIPASASPLTGSRSILEPFVQADGSMTRKYGGTGLGAHDLQAVGRADGRTAVDRESGRAWEHLPFHRRLWVQQEETTATGTATQVDMLNLPVLVVDDNATNRRILHDMLCHWQMQATEVDSGQAALTMLAQARDKGTPFPLVLLDAHMPEMDGFIVAARIKARSAPWLEQPS